jgi:large subunit ribosomal protein L3
MGNARVTVKGSTVYDFDVELDVLAVSGSVPGPNGGLLFVRLVSERTAEDMAEMEGGDGNA